MFMDTLAVEMWLVSHELEERVMRKRGEFYDVSYAGACIFNR